MRIGVDVGGTNTDAVLVDGRDVLAEAKTPTTPEVTDGVVTALRSLVDADAASRVQAVMIGTTHFTNAVVEARRLAPTGVIRLGLPATEALPPMTAWPQPLREALGGHVRMCHGGHEFDGRRIAPLDHDELRRAAGDFAAAGIDTVSISSVFSPVNAEAEQEAAAVVERELPGAAISLSHEIGRIGLLERENATIMNACLRRLATQIVAAFRGALAELGIEAPLYLSQNDGTLMGVEYAERYPVATFASGPTNSMRGAAFLSGLADCAVIDVGGTTSDVGILQRGFPREASVSVEIGGVRTNFRMPDVLSLGIGGGSHVNGTEVGPQSVGYELTEKALVFGGDTLTATDLAVAAGLAEIGDRDRVDVDPEPALARIQERLAETVDRMKTSADPIPVVVVGGGSILVRDELAGASEVVRPDHFAVANAIGAAIAEIGGEVDKVVALEGTTRAAAIDEATSEAVEKAVAAGAEHTTVRVVDVEDVPIAYLPGNATRIRVKAVGELDLERIGVAAGR
jgi:N-methylhydantoinase A/oxoprolinase/acetone carboxylase beta subunit